MFKKITFILCAFAVLLLFASCANSVEEEIEDYVEYTEAEDEYIPDYDLSRLQFEAFFEENKTDIIETVATEGEDVRLEITGGYEFIMTIILDDIELTEENRASYILTFELYFSEMSTLFGGLARDIKEAAGLDHFRLTVVFTDAFEEEIARSPFDAGERGLSGLNNSAAEVDEDGEEVED